MRNYLQIQRAKYAPWSGRDNPLYSVAVDMILSFLASRVLPRYVARSSLVTPRVMMPLMAGATRSLASTAPLAYAATAKNVTTTRGTPTKKPIAKRTPVRKPAVKKAKAKKPVAKKRVTPKKKSRIVVKKPKAPKKRLCCCPVSKCIAGAHGWNFLVARL